MILAAGRGERMRPLTDVTPKPLLRAGGKPLIEWHIQNLAQAGYTDLVINHAHLGAQIEATLGDGSRFGVSLHYSPEAEALETAGGIANALEMLGPEPFLVVNGDIFCDYDFRSLPQDLGELAAWLVLVNNPEHHLGGDFSLREARVLKEGEHKLTFSGIGLYRPEIFAGVKPGSKARLAPLLCEQMADRKVGGEHFRGKWMDIGTPERLRELDSWLTGKAL